jgi:pimeloyl-ACP methyl ester carboxylesterase
MSVHKGATLVVLAIVSAFVAAQPGGGAFMLPSPTGPLHVATARWVITDPSHRDPFDAAEPRRVEVVAWYPTDATSGAPAPYLREGPDSIRSFARAFGNINLFDDLVNVRTHAIQEAPPAARPAKLPLLVFSHGYTSVPAASTALLEDLASHGYAVLSVIHPHESSASTIADGRVVTMTDDGGRMRQPIQDVLGEWRREDAIMGEVTAAQDRGAQLRRLREYLSTLPRTHEALRRWLDDIRAVVAQWSTVTDGTAGALQRRVNLARFGVFGHSMGGVSSAEYCLGEPRCRAVLNLDGIPQYGSMIDERLGRPLLMMYSSRPGRIGASDAIYERTAHPYHKVVADGTRHLDFTDMVFWPALRERKILGTAAPDAVTANTRAVVQEFFDQELLGRRSTILSGRRRLPGVTVTRHEGSVAAPK